MTRPRRSVDLALQAAPLAVFGVLAASSSWMPIGAVVHGAYAPVLALQAPVVALVSRQAARVNPGDLYASRGVRWYMGEPGTSPS